MGTLDQTLDRDEVGLVPLGEEEFAKPGVAASGRLQLSA